MMVESQLADTEESDDEEGEDRDESDEEYGDTPQSSQSLCELRVQLNEDDIPTKKNKKKNAKFVIKNL
ncbi:unnamed protein product [Brachionus calyciflorus]|uniref:Uncharacterized protein n=1 Tax=Brachionus calyciflorus TaxID=104777 RepID=A0A814SX13_9BILA|nr:unnamed protein product [Brachionus calyciflorus]